MQAARTMTAYHSAFGLRLRSNTPIPGLLTDPECSIVDVDIDLGAMPVALTGLHQELWYTSDARDYRNPALLVWRVGGNAYFRFRYSDTTEFVVDRQSSHVWATWPDTLTLDDTATYLLGPILGFVLRLRGVTCLHASAVAVGDRAIALLGPANAGKSTTAAAFSRMGYPVLTDDIVALVERDAGPSVQPGYPQLRLWPDSVAALYGSADALPPLTPTWDKRALTLTRDGAFQNAPLPLAAIYVLAERSAETEQRVDELKGRESLLTLLGNTYVGYLLDAAMRGQEFDSLVRLISRVPVRRITPSANPADVSRLCGRILDDCEALGCTASPTTAR